MAGGKFECTRPALLSHGGHQLFRALGGEAIICRAETAASAFASTALPTVEVDEILNDGLAAGWTGVALSIQGGTSGAPTPAVKSAFIAAGNTINSN